LLVNKVSYKAKLSLNLSASSSHPVGSKATLCRLAAYGNNMIFCFAEQTLTMMKSFNSFLLRDTGMHSAYTCYGDVAGRLAGWVGG